MNSCISYILLITVLYWVNINEAIRWDKSLPYQQIVKANNSGPAEFLWRYELTSDDSVLEDKTLVISCGYIKDSKLVRLVRKVNDNGQIAINKDTSKHGDVFGTRVRVYTPKTGGNNNNRVVGFVVDPVRKSDPDRYQCSASARQTTLLHEQFQSDVSRLRILDPPRFINCLRQLKPVVAQKALKFTCEVVGFPEPKMQCQLLSFDDKILDKLPSGFKNQNLTERLFSPVPKEARKIRCIAEADDTGSKNVTETIEVKHEPFKPSYFLVSPHTVNSVNVTWSQIPRNETGIDSINIEYRLTYYVQTLGKLNSTSVVIKPPINWYAYNNTIYATQIVVDLSPKLEYSFTVYGRNSYGDGVKVTQLFTPIVKPTVAPRTGSNVGVIVGAVVGSIVAIVILVLIVVWCSRRQDKNKKYPTSYVEDAVDYPPNKETQLYADVQKKPKSVSRDDSTSGYPDTNGYNIKNSASYEDSNKVYL